MKLTLFRDPTHKEKTKQTRTKKLSVLTDGQTVLSTANQIQRGSFEWFDSWTNTTTCGLTYDLWVDPQTLFWIVRKWVHVAMVILRSVGDVRQWQLKLPFFPPN